MGQTICYILVAYREIVVFNCFLVAYSEIFVLICLLGG